jgi:predicted Zn-dependent protease
MQSEFGRPLVKNLEAAQFALGALKKAGAEDAQVIVRLQEKDELNVEIGEVSLFRTVINPSIHLKAFRGGKLGRATTNRLQRESIEGAVAQVMELMEASAPDPAYALGPQATGSFRRGEGEADPEKCWAVCRSSWNFRGKILPR